MTDIRLKVDQYAPDMVTVDTSTDISGSSTETSVDSRLECWLRVDRVTIDISTDASVAVLVEVRYETHDPKFQSFIIFTLFTEKKQINMI